MLVWIVAGSLMVAAPGPKDAPKKESPLVGQWRLVRANGERPVGDQVETFAADGSCVIRTRIEDRESEERGQYTTNPATSPAEFDYVFNAAEGGNIKGIYKVDGDTLTICYQTGKGERPKEFKAVRNVIILFVYQRVKTKD
jgi:uncharacterized protein (TIGR03067 family)